MRERGPLLGFVGAILLLALPASSAVRTWRAVGTIESVIGTPSLLPLPAAPGDEYVIEFSYDTDVPDASALPDLGSYPILSLSVSIEGDTLDFIDGMGGQGRVAIQANATDPNLWGVSACLGSCGDAIDEARVNFFFPPDTILSDVLTDPPDPTGASIQFGQFSRDFPAPEEAFVAATFESITLVPEPARALMLAAGALALLTAPRVRARVGGTPAR